MNTPCTKTSLTKTFVDKTGPEGEKSDVPSRAQAHTQNTITACKSLKSSVFTLNEH